ncbi:hypothetical protein BDR06DRAFT_1015171 [Suillus hirtellus]|nr:hypothetical protein BDR06DRAFT_1015171 [Suillus hirtellus]
MSRIHHPSHSSRKSRDVKFIYLPSANFSLCFLPSPSLVVFSPLSAFTVHGGGHLLLRHLVFSLSHGFDGWWFLVSMGVHHR